MPLSEALSSIVEETAESLGLSSRIVFSGEERPLSGDIERLMYRLAQEALYQVQQHTGTRKLRFVLHYGRDELQLHIEDDGVPQERNELRPRGMTLDHIIRTDQLSSVDPPPPDG